jgi:hypothetical protein
MLTFCCALRKGVDKTKKSKGVMNLNFCIVRKNTNYEKLGVLHLCY